MNQHNREQNVADELARAERAFQALEVLTEHGFVNDAVSKLYYALLYLVRALLLTQGLEVRSHEGALRMLAQHFVKDGRLDRGATQLFAKLMKYREEADYNPVFDFAAEDVPALRREVDALAARIRALIAESSAETGSAEGGPGQVNAATALGSRQSPEMGKGGSS